MDNSSEQIPDKCKKKRNEKLIFTRGVLDYLDKLNMFFKTGKIDKISLKEIPVNVNAIIALIYYIIQQIIMLRESNLIKGVKISAIVFKKPTNN